jgi:hypothetical protein
MYHKEHRNFNTCKEAGIKANAEKTMLLSCHQNAGQNHNIKTANRSFQNVAQF